MDVGQVYNSNHYGSIEVVELLTKTHSKVRFTNTGSIKTFRNDAIRNGQIRDMFSPKTYGVGYIGEGRYAASKKGEHSKHYHCWSGMLERCYSDKFHSSINYKGKVTVWESWLNYQVFCEWYEGNYIKGWHLDKDISKSSLYSPESCHFLPRELNTFFTTRRHFRGEYPIGVLYKCGSYEATISGGTKGSHIYLGVFDTPEKAFNKYRDAKKAALNSLICKYEDLLPKRTKEVLENYEFVPFPE